MKLCARRSPSLVLRPIPPSFRSHTLTLLAGHQTAKLDKKLERLSVVSEEKKAQRKKKRKDSERDAESESHAQNDEASEDQQQPPPKVSLKALSLLTWNHRARN